VYLLDTNVLSEVLRPRPNVAVVRRLFSTSPAALFASEMTRYELRYGAALHPRPEAIWSQVVAEILPLPLWLPIDEPTALAAGNLRGELRRAGKPIEVQDAFLAATSRTHDLVLVTRNVRHFENVPGLAVENWFGEADSWR
jgi:predicted nucleic acid-binding protein